MKTVAILLTSKPQIGGEHTYLVDIMRSLLLHDKKEIRVIGICYNHYWCMWCKNNNTDYIFADEDYYMEEEMKVQSKLLPFRSYINSRKTILGRIVVDCKIDVLICGQQVYFTPKLPCKVIKPVHDLMHRYTDIKELIHVRERRDLIQGSAKNCVDLVLVDSELGKQHYLESYGRNIFGYPKIEVVPFGTISELLNSKEEYVNVPQKFIFYPAQFWEHKNHLNLVKAVGILKKEIPDIYLVLVGSENKNVVSKITKEIEVQNISNNINMLGFVTLGQLKFLYRNAVAMVMPSFGGPTNIPPIEAMALGCPPIVSNNFAMGEQVGDAGLLFDPGKPEEIADQIKRVWIDETYRKELSKRGIDQAKKFTFDVFAERVFKIVTERV